MIAHCPRNGLPVVAANVSAVMPPQRLDLLMIAAVPRDNRRYGNPFLIDKDARFTHAGDANGSDVGRAGSSVDCRPKRHRSIEQLLGGEFDTEGRGDP